MIKKILALMGFMTCCLSVAAYVHYYKKAGAGLDWSYYSKTQTADLQKGLQKLSLGAVLSKKD